MLVDKLNLGRSFGFVYDLPTVVMMSSGLPCRLLLLRSAGRPSYSYKRLSFFEFLTERLLRPTVRNSLTSGFGLGLGFDSVGPHSESKQIGGRGREELLGVDHFGFEEAGLDLGDDVCVHY